MAVMEIDEVLVAKELLFDLQVLHNRLDHQRSICQITREVGRDQPRTRLLRRLGTPLTFGCQLVKLGANTGNGLRGGALAVVEQTHGVARSGSNLRDAGTHGAGSDDGNNRVL